MQTLDLINLRNFYLDKVRSGIIKSKYESALNIIVELAKSKVVYTDKFIQSCYYNFMGLIEQAIFEDNAQSILIDKDINDFISDIIYNLEIEESFEACENIKKFDNYYNA